MSLFDIFSPVRKLKKIVEQINGLESEMAQLDAQFLPNEAEKLREILKAGGAE